MKRLIVLLGISLLSTRCSHPESEKFERNKGAVKKTENDVVSIATEPYENMNAIEMEEENGVRFIWVEINGIKLRFIFDTGASSICISPAEATVLYRQGTLKQEDILDVQQFQDATGRISEGVKITLRNVKIGNAILENVEANIVNSKNAPLLLGQTVLERFGKIEIDNKNNKIILK